MSVTVTYGYGPAPGTLTSTTYIPATEMGGVFVSTTSGGTLAIYDGNTTASGSLVVTQFTPAAATYYQLPFRCKNGGFNFVVGGTIAFTPAVS